MDCTGLKHNAQHLKHNNKITFFFFNLICIYLFQVNSITFISTKKVFYFSNLDLYNFIGRINETTHIGL